MKRQTEKECIIVPLPSKGECYPHKKGEVPIAYMTAMDENVLADKKLNDEWKAIDTLLEKKILDKDFKVDELCVGDRDAILLSLLIENYGSIYEDFSTQEKIDLSKINYSNFNLVGNEKGLFEYKGKDGVVCKFRLMKNNDDKEGYQILENCKGKEDLEQYKRWFLERLTVSVNDNEDRVSIQKHISSLNDNDVDEYFDYIYNHDAYIETDLDLEVALCGKTFILTKQHENRMV